MQKCGDMNKRQLRLLAQKDPQAFRNHIAGARQRELTARYLLLHPEEVAKASPEQMIALREYIEDGGWKNLYNHDRRMWQMLRAGVQRLHGL
jgi:hypothetical protein